MAQNLPDTQGPYLLVHKKLLHWLSGVYCCKIKEVRKNFGLEKYAASQNQGIKHQL